MNRMRAVSLFAFTLYLFHILRNLTPAYLALLGLALILFLASLIANRNRQIADAIVLAAFLSWLFASLVTFTEAGEYGDPAVGIFRLWASFPLALIASALAVNSIETPARILSVFFLLAAISFFVQYFTGPIAWFAEASERAGGVRFASLAGSLTAYGVGVGVPALASLYYFKRPVGLSIFFALAIGALFSLQKAAIANIFLAFMLALWLGAPHARARALSGPALLLIPIFFLLYGDNTDSRTSTALRYLEGIFTSDTELSGDVTFIESIVDRITALPVEALQFFELENLWLGAGAFGGSGALGYPDLPMAHNGLIELVLVFGYVVGCTMALFLLTYFFISLGALLSRRRVAKTEFGFLCAGYVIWFINYLFSGGGVFHPIGAAVFWLLVLRLRYIRRMHVNKRVRLGVTHLTSDRSALDAKLSWVQRDGLTHGNG